MGEAVWLLKNYVAFDESRTFSQEASGSDLDGDVYLITWNPDLIPTVRNFRPLEYEAPKPVTVEDRVTIDNIISFFLDYIRNDNLGLIAVAHKIHADLNANGVLSDKCIELAKLHTLAVDFPKTGVPAHFDPQRYRTPQRPDFLCSRGGRAENSYVSQKALGKMFRAACNRAFTPDYSKVVVDARFLAAGLDAYFDEALAVKSCFDFDVRRILLQFGVRSEFELFTQFIFDFDRHGTTREFEMKERLRNLVRQMTTQYELIFWEGRGKLERRVTKEACAKAAAWYFVTV